MANSPTTANLLGKAILEAVNLPVDRCTEVALRCVPGGLACIDVSYCVGKNDIGNIVNAVRQFDLVERKG